MSQVREVELFVDEASEGQRLDRFVALKVPEISRSKAQKLILSQHVLVNGMKAEKDHRVKKGEHVKIEIASEEPSKLVAQPIPIRILFEDKHLLVVSKPAHMVVHPSYGHGEGTLANALLYHLQGPGAISADLRPGIVHRLDKGTSGLLIVGKTEKSTLLLAEMMKRRTVDKYYVAVVRGKLPKESGEIDAPVGRSKSDRKKIAVMRDGRPARTKYAVLETHGPYSLVLIRIYSGRTHQIRVHFKHLGNPVVGDPQYGTTDQLTRSCGLHRQFLHAIALGFKHPITGQSVFIVDELPDDLVAFLSAAGFKTRLTGLSKEFFEARFPDGEAMSH